MELANAEAPQLTVEIENIRKDSIPCPSREMDKTLVEENFNNDEIKAASTTSSAELDSNTNNDSDNKKVDPEFGLMETIPLEISIQERISQSESVSIESSEKSLAAANDLRKYFNVDPLNLENKDSDGIRFFNALSENFVKEGKDILAEGKKNHMNGKSETIPHQVVSEAHGIMQDDKAIENSGGNDDQSKNPPPILLKFFAEDKSGKDKDGKAFFDKIGDDTVIQDFPTLEINQPVLNIPNSESFLNTSTCSSEIEEAWIPSEKTRQILVSIITSSAPFSPDKSHLTSPGVIIEDEMEDPVKSLLIECNSPYAQQRKALTANDVSEDERGLKELMEKRCYHAAINLTKRLLETCGQGPGNEGKPSKHTPLSLRLWYTRLALFVKLKKFSFAEVESAAFGDLDKPDLYYEYYPDINKGKQGIMVPFALRLLLAELPQYQGNQQAALDNMYHILNIIQKILNNVQNGCAEDGSMIKLSESRKAASLEIWKRRERRVLFSILNCVLAQKDYILAVSIAKILIEKSTTDVAQLHSALGRIYLQLGDVLYAENCFKKASIIAQKNSEDFRVEENVNSALLSVACDDNEKAFKYFEQAHSIKPDPMLVNNMAVCKLYIGQLRESLRLLETAIHNDPSTCLHDGLLFNVCTLYELESSRCPQKKLAMLELVSKYEGDAFNVNCLKIQTAKA